MNRVQYRNKSMIYVQKRQLINAWETASSETDTNETQMGKSRSRVSLSYRQLHWLHHHQRVNTAVAVAEYVSELQKRKYLDR